MQGIGAAVLAPSTLALLSVPGRLDLAGALSSTLGMTALVYGIVRSADTGWYRPAPRVDRHTSTKVIGMLFTMRQGHGSLSSCLRIMRLG